MRRGRPISSVTESERHSSWWAHRSRSDAAPRAARPASFARGRPVTAPPLRRACTCRRRRWGCCFCIPAALRGKHRQPAVRGLLESIGNASRSDYTSSPTAHYHHLYWSVQRVMLLRSGGAAAARDHSDAVPGSTLDRQRSATSTWRMNPRAHADRALRRRKVADSGAGPDRAAGACDSRHKSCD